MARRLPFVLVLSLTCLGFEQVGRSAGLQACRPAGSPKGLRYAQFCSALSAAAAASNPSSSALFSSYDVVPLKLEAPFNQLFDHARTDDSYSVTGSLSYTDGGRQVTLEGIKISLRGHTSKAESECPFPKLKLQFPPRAPAEGSLLAGLASLKIGTHCGESTDGGVTAKYGRLANEQSPNREAFVYRLLEAVGVPTLKARPARITYVYTDARSGRSPAQDQPLVRNAMLLENSDHAVRRLGGHGEVSVKAFTDARAQFAVADTARLAFAEALIGNFDWCLKMTPDDTYRCDARDPLWNIVAARLADGRARPLIYDFDVAGMVTGRHSWFTNTFNEAFVSSRSHAEIEVLAQLQRTRTLFTRSELDAARAEFVQRKTAAYQALERAGLDLAGRRTAQEYLDSFFKTIASDEAFYRPVVTKAGATAYANENRAAVCSSNSSVPIGTPVSEPLQTKGSLIQVNLLDALWHWAPPVKCPAVREGPVWIDADAVSRDFPKK